MVIDLDFVRKEGIVNSLKVEENYTHGLPAWKQRIARFSRNVFLLFLWFSE